MAFLLCHPWWKAEEQEKTGERHREGEGEGRGGGREEGEEEESKKELNSPFYNEFILAMRTPLPR